MYEVKYIRFSSLIITKLQMHNESLYLKYTSISLSIQEIICTPKLLVQSLQPTLPTLASTMQKRPQYELEKS